MLTIVPAYQGMTRYISEARADPGADLEALWRNHVLDPYWNQWAAGEFNEERTRRELSQPIRDLDGLEREITALAGSGVEELIAGAYHRLAGLLPYHDTPAAVCIMAANPQDQGLEDQLSGVVGACIGGNTLLTINPTAPGWQAWILYVLAHERHHSAWGYHHFFVRQRAGGTLLVSLLSEGQADWFASQLCPELRPSWLYALSPEEERRQWALMGPSLQAPDPEGALHRRFFFGCAEVGIPRWTGYTIAYHLLQKYQDRHPEESLFDMMDREPETILAESGYPG